MAYVIFIRGIYKYLDLVKMKMLNYLARLAHVVVFAIQVVDD